MKKIFYVPALALTAWLTMLSCNEARRGNDGGLKVNGNEAAAEPDAGKLARKKEGDAEFVYETVASQYGEIKLAELAIQRSHNAEVKRIAEQLRKDHSASLNELKTLAQAKAISVPVEETDEAKKMLENIADESGKEFDEKWCDELMNMHRESMDKFEKRKGDTEDAELKTYLDKNLPALKSHDESLKKLQAHTEK